MESISEIQSGAESAPGDVDAAQSAPAAEAPASGEAAAAADADTIDTVRALAAPG